MEKVPAIIPGQKTEDRTKEKYPYRNLAKHEIDQLVVLYDKHNGNLTALSKDPDSQFKTRNQLHYYKKLYDFNTLLGQFRGSLIQDYKQESINILNRAKIKIIEQAMKLISTRTIIKTSMITGESYEIEIDPTAHDLEVAYKMIKTELGEPSTITKQHNINEEEQNKINLGLDLIKNAIEKHSKAISDK